MLDWTGSETRPTLLSKEGKWLYTTLQPEALRGKKYTTLSLSLFVSVYLLLSFCLWSCSTAQAHSLSSSFSLSLSLSPQDLTQPDRCTNSLDRKKFNHTFFSFLCFKFNHYKHCSKCYEKKCTLVFLFSSLCVSLYKAGRSRVLCLTS